MTLQSRLPRRWSIGFILWRNGFTYTPFYGFDWPVFLEFWMRVNDYDYHDYILMLRNGMEQQ